MLVVSAGCALDLCSDTTCHQLAGEEPAALLAALSPSGPGRAQSHAASPPAAKGCSLQTSGGNSSIVAAHAITFEEDVIAATSSGGSTTAAADELATEEVDMPVQDVGQKDPDGGSDRDQQRLVAQDGEWAVQLTFMSHLKCFCAEGDGWPAQHDL